MDGLVVGLVVSRRMPKTYRKRVGGCLHREMIFFEVI